MKSRGKAQDSSIFGNSRPQTVGVHDYFRSPEGCGTVHLSVLSPDCLCIARQTSDCRAHGLVRRHPHDIIGPPSAAELELEYAWVACWHRRTASPVGKGKEATDFGAPGHRRNPQRRPIATKTLQALGSIRLVFRGLTGPRVNGPRRIGKTHQGRGTKTTRNRLLISSSLLLSSLLGNRQRAFHGRLSLALSRLTVNASVKGKRTLLNRRV
jgi:hypothetical protein